MIIWLNGAFGIGKTQTAFELHSRIPGSFVFDPEQIGFFLCRIVPSKVCVGDFQNHRIWREYTYQGLQYVAENFAGTRYVAQLPPRSERLLTILRTNQIQPQTLRTLDKICIMVYIQLYG